jgi:hypothetical protein
MSNEWDTQKFHSSVQHKIPTREYLPGDVINYGSTIVCNLKNYLAWVFLSRSHCPVYQPMDAEAILACLQEFFLDSAID